MAIHDDEPARRAYWTAQMEEAEKWVQTVFEYPIQESGEPMTSLRDLAASIGGGVKIDFSTTLQAGKNPRLFFIRQGLAANFTRVAKALHDRGWSLKVEDGYRTPQMQRDFSHSPKHFDGILRRVMWELNGQVPSADLMYRRFSMLVATRCRVGTHVSGSAIDVTIFDRATGKEIDRGAPTGESSERTSMATPFITPEQRRNRDEIERIFRQCGWCAYPFEFWHYSSGDCFAEYLTNSGKPGRYGAILFDGQKITPLTEEEAQKPLQPLEFYQQQIQAALARLEKNIPATAQA